ncbi:hypothetical protein H072_3873 [Dactylellina haptotyla CBS 200.50]|uniref:Uncharacterized protein n=1 Tax=Dactylellina haptotyla (strain CBS 200.50) TaxID=1284197 RepID=S8C355_DACHA|nr:hypothetical protein H072_3873 [Dactylellina haptotyla CBS 200.50]
MATEPGHSVAKMTRRRLPASEEQEGPTGLRASTGAPPHHLDNLHLHQKEPLNNNTSQQTAPQPTARRGSLYTSTTSSYLQNYLDAAQKAMSTPSDPPKTPGTGPPKRGGVSALLARFEQSGGSPNSSSGSTSATPEFKPKPIGRVKTNFVAVTDANGVMGLRKADGEISPVKTPTKFAFGAPLGDASKKFESPKNDKPAERPPWVTNGKKDEVKKEEPKVEEPPKLEEKVEPVEEIKEALVPETAPEVTKEPEPPVVELALEKETVPDVEELAKEPEAPAKEVPAPKSPTPEPAAVEEPTPVPETLVLSGKGEPVEEEPEVQAEEPVVEAAEPEAVPEEAKVEEPAIEEPEAVAEPEPEVAEQVVEAAEASINVLPPTPVATKAPTTVSKVSPSKIGTARTTKTAPTSRVPEKRVTKPVEPKPSTRPPSSKPAEVKPKASSTTTSTVKPRSTASTSSTTRTAPTKISATKASTAPKVAESGDAPAEGETSVKAKRLSTGASKTTSPKAPAGPISARSSGPYGPTSSSSSKLSPSGPPKTSTTRAKTPSRLTASNRPSSRMTHTKSPSVSPTRAEHRIRNTQSRASMASESTVRPKSQQIDPNFLARLSRPTASSASKVVEKRVVSPPAPTVAKKVGSQKSSRSKRTDDDERSTSTRASIDQDQRPVFEDNGPNDEHHETAPDLSEHQPAIQT